MKKSVLLLLPIALLAVSCGGGNDYGNKIDRKTLLARNNPHVEAIDPLSPLSVGNGGFCFTADVTGLQSIPQAYTAVPLSTQSAWGWHNFPNIMNYKSASMYDAQGKLITTGKAAKELEDCKDYFTLNQHRIELGQIGFKDMVPESISGIDQTLDLWTGTITSRFNYNGKPVSVVTSCDPEADMVAAKISSEDEFPVTISVAYPTYIDEGNPMIASFASTFDSELRSEDNSAVILVKMNASRYSIRVNCENAYIRQPDRNVYEIVPTAKNWGFTAEYAFGRLNPEPGSKLEASQKASAEYWNDWWQKGGAVDFSACTDPRAAELERRVVLSQYLTGIQCSGIVPGHDGGLTGLADNGKVDADNVTWQTAQFALWGHPEQLTETFKWYEDMLDEATASAKLQSISGARWANLCGINGIEAPSKAGRVSQQPNLIYLLDVLENCGQDVSAYAALKDATLGYIDGYMGRLTADSTYVLAGIPMQGRQEKVAEQPAFESAYWFYALNKHAKEHWHYAQLCKHFAPLAIENGLYLCAAKDGDESGEGHPAVLAALGMLPATGYIDANVMKATLEDILTNWDWDTARGADFAMTAMCAARLGEPQKAIDALLMDKAANKYLANGLNGQNGEVSLTGNGGLLSAIALMCAGWNGCETQNPGFPADGSWNIRWEKINPLP